MANQQLADLIVSCNQIVVPTVSVGRIEEVRPTSLGEMALQAAYHSSDTRPPFLFVTTEGAAQ